MELLYSLVSPGTIIGLPWQVSVPGIIIVAFYMMRGFFSLFKFRLFKAVTSVFWAVCIIIILSQGGEAIAKFVGVSNAPPKLENKL